jgi:archaellin
MFTKKAELSVGVVVALVAMVLVVAVAVGVMVNAVVFLQDEAGDSGEATSTEGRLQVSEADLAVNDPASDDVDVAAGGNDAMRPVAYELRLEVTPENGTEEIDLADLAVRVTGPEETVELRHVSEHVEGGDLVADEEVAGTDVARGVYFVQPIAVERMDTVATNTGDRYELVVPVGVYIGPEGTVRENPTSQARVTAPVQDYDDADVGIEVPGVLDANQGIANMNLDVLESADSVTVEIRTDGGVETTVTVEVPSLDGEEGSQVPVRPR